MSIPIITSSLAIVVSVAHMIGMGPTITKAPPLTFLSSTLGLSLIDDRTTNNMYTNTSRIPLIKSAIPRDINVTFTTLTPLRYYYISLLVYYIEVMSKEALDSKYTHKVLEKAERLISEGRVYQVSRILFYVMGYHGKYFVSIEEGKFRCTCKGYRRRGSCSHIVAVLLLMSREDYKRKLDEAMKKRLELNLEYIRRGAVPR